MVVISNWIKWHHKLHQVTGQLALKMGKQPDVTLLEMAASLREIADEMEADAREQRRAIQSS